MSRELSPKDYRAELLNAVAHELNTPLTPILLHLLMIEERIDSLDPATRESIRAIQRNAERLHGLIQDVLSIGALERSRYPVRVARMDLAELVREAVQDFRRPAELVGIRIVVDAPRTMVVDGDRARLMQVMQHLLRNAMRHTPQGGEIFVTVAQEGLWASVSVADTGGGFAPGLETSIFEPFADRAAAAEDTQKDPGLGLYICRSILDLHSGEIRAQSPGLGHGSTFTFRIPIHERRRQAERKAVEFDERIRNLT